MPKARLGLAIAYRKEEENAVLLRAFRRSVEASVK
jgi:hypothetical protein